MPHLTLTENLKLQLSPGLVASYDIQPGNGVGLFCDKHTHMATRKLFLYMGLQLSCLPHFRQGSYSFPAISR